ncbi:hypothetical protein AURDEDRAFT_178313 [Auricularia subglabra TFB-10046 SS5]|uniref:Uncharacterized protein n=1 Tax=Auricularia subglabra (strain TFB-10046 / SS5) TaxID=717982 RepID=J0CQU6_AURST|nr:hypothetical protein AURDEDRAFT_178313 [Auricularia subglabra TFB-10046 SS5]
MLGTFVRTLRKSVRTLGTFVRTLGTFVRTLGKSVRILRTFVRTLRTFVRTAGESVRTLGKSVRTHKLSCARTNLVVRIGTVALAALVLEVPHLGFLLLPRGRSNTVARLHRENERAPRLSALRASLCVRARRAADGSSRIAQDHRCDIGMLSSRVPLTHSLTDPIE